MNKCKGCEWYGKPYWSIINPCDNCPRENTNVEILSRWQDPTIEQLQQRIEYLERSNNRREDEILELRKENADLDNIINELENILKENKERCNVNAKIFNKDFWLGLEDVYKSLLDKLQELNGENNDK